MFMARATNRDIGGWNVSNVRDMGTCSPARAASIRTSAAGMSQCEDMSDVRRRGQLQSGHRPLGRPNVRFMTTCSMAADFNQDIGRWDVSNVRDMSWMFHDANYNTGNIGGWKVPCGHMSHMFAARATSIKTSAAGRSERGT